MRSMDIAATGMQAQQTNIEVIANNIANMTTTAFKRRRPEFQDLIYQQLGVAAGANSSDTGTIVPAGAEVGLGVQTAAIYPILEQGNLQQTNNTLDLAIQGAGYFQIQLPYGQIGYTRDGTFALSPTGQIVTADGYVVWPGMTVPQNATSISINAQGQVQVTIPNQTQPQLIGQLQIVTLPTRPVLRRKVAICSSPRRPRETRSKACPAPRVSAPSCKVLSKPPTSTWSPRSPISLPRSAPMK